MNTALYKELVFTWEKKIAEAVFEHEILCKMISKLFIRL